MVTGMYIFAKWLILSFISKAVAGKLFLWRAKYFRLCGQKAKSRIIHCITREETLPLPHLVWWVGSLRWEAYFVPTCHQIRHSQEGPDKLVCDHWDHFYFLFHWQPRSWCALTQPFQPGQLAGGEATWVVVFQNEIPLVGGVQWLPTVESPTRRCQPEWALDSCKACWAVGGGRHWGQSGKEGCRQYLGLVFVVHGASLFRRCQEAI